MHVDRSERATAQNAYTEPRQAGRRGKVTLAALVLCAMVMTLLAPAATAATISKTTASVAEHQAVSAALAASKPGGISLLRAAPATVTGAAADGSNFNGTFKLQRFKEHKGVLYAVGTLTGTLGEKSVKRHVSLPVTGATNEAATGLRQQMGALAPVPTPGACDILTLNLGPLDLNLLGLRVALDPVNLLIEAIPGAGNLLGNLLCSVAGLLDGGLLGGGLGNLLNNLLAAISNLLNGLLGGLG